MSATPVEPMHAASLAQHTLARPAGTDAGRVPFLPYVWVLTGFWVYVMLSNLMYANNMQASLSSMKLEHVFAPSSARLLQHLFMYPLFILCMWRALRTGWTAWSDFFAGPEIPTWVASATNFLVTYCFGLALTTGLAFYQRLRDAQLRTSALERALTQAHLAALRMQLSPHTLFNLLHTIRGQITWDPPAAQTMVVQLADLLRRLLTATEREFSRLGDELQFVSLYLDLQRKRFSDRLAVCAPERAGLPPAWVPSLILQPLVENAVVHGLAGHEQPVTIRVEVEVAGEELTLRVSNTIARGKIAGAVGIGLANVRERLVGQFGRRARFTAGPAGAELWVATIVMPLLRDGPEPERAPPGGTP